MPVPDSVSPRSVATEATSHPRSPYPINWEWMQKQHCIQSFASLRTRAAILSLSACAQPRTSREDRRRSFNSRGHSRGRSQSTSECRRACLTAGRAQSPPIAQGRQAEQRAEKVQRAESVLAATGIRKLRREPVFITSPNIFPAEIAGAAVPPARPRPKTRKCYVCKKVL